MCVDGQYPDKKSFQFLTEIQKSFVDKYCGGKIENVKSALEGSNQNYQKDFEALLKKTI